MSKTMQYREAIGYLNATYGGDWFWNIISQRFEDFMTDRSFSREQVGEK